MEWVFLYYSNFFVCKCFWRWFLILSWVLGFRIRLRLLFNIDFCLLCLFWDFFLWSWSNLLKTLRELFNWCLHLFTVEWSLVSQRTWLLWLRGGVWIRGNLFNSLFWSLIRLSFVNILNLLFFWLWFLVFLWCFFTLRVVFTFWFLLWSFLRLWNLFWWGFSFLFKLVLRICLAIWNQVHFQNWRLLWRGFLWRGVLYDLNFFFFMNFRFSLN